MVKPLDGGGGDGWWPERAASASRQTHAAELPCHCRGRRGSVRRDSRGGSSGSGGAGIRPAAVGTPATAGSVCLVLCAWEGGMVCGVCILRNGQRGPSRAVYALDSPAAQPMRKLHVDFDFFFPHKLKFYMHLFCLFFKR